MDIRKNIVCKYCEEEYHIKFHEDLTPQFCTFCGESFEIELEDEEDDGDLDYTDDDTNEY